MSDPHGSGRPVLRLLLDEHGLPEVAIQLARHRPSLVVYPLQAWGNGSYLG